MSIQPRRMIDELVRECERLGSPVWDEVAKSLGMDPKPIWSAMTRKEKNLGRELTDAEEYAVEQLTKLKAKIGTEAFAEAKKIDPRWVADLASSRYSIKERDYAKRQAASFMRALAKVVGYGSDVYNEFMLEVSQTMPSDDLADVDEMISEYYSNRES